MMESREVCCRLCLKEVAANRRVHLFTSTGIKNRWGPRITDLLDVPVGKDDGLSSCIYM